jgi:hypothetical protein
MPKITPLDWEKKLNGFAPDEPEVSRIYPNKKNSLDSIPQDEERMNRFQRQRKQQKEGK